MRRILVVEDEDMLRDVYHMVLSTEPFIVDIAENGAKALELCQAHAYDLILLDLMMPVLDGVGFLRAYNAGEDSSAARVIILSNLSSGRELEEALKLGALRSELKANLSPKQLVALVRYELEAV